MWTAASVKLNQSLSTQARFVQTNSSKMISVSYQFPVNYYNEPNERRRFILKTFLQVNLNLII